MRSIGKRRAASSIPKNTGSASLSRRQVLSLAAESASLVAILAYLFFDRLWAAAFLFPLGILFARKQAEVLELQRLQKRKEEFRETLLCVGSASAAGYSMENAWRAACREMESSYGKESETVKALRRMVLRLGMNENLETVLSDFASWTGLEEAEDFSQVFYYAKRSGGSMKKIISDTISQITEKLEVEREVRTAISSKRLEQRIMNVVPIGILLYLKLASPGYLDPLYDNAAGIVIMSVALGVYTGAWLLSEKIVRIEV